MYFIKNILNLIAKCLMFIVIGFVNIIIFIFCEFFHLIWITMWFVFIGIEFLNAIYLPFFMQDLEPPEFRFAITALSAIFIFIIWMASSIGLFQLRGRFVEKYPFIKLKTCKVWERPIGW